MGTINEYRWNCHFPMDVLLVFVVVLQTVGRIECSNLEVRLPMVKEGPMDSLFGFSVAEHIVSMKEPTLSDNYDGSLILAGAPTYDDPDALVAKTGAVFKCPLSTYVDDCQDMNLDITGNDATENKTDQWLGVTVRSQGQGGRVATCAHRYKVLSSDKISGLGKCYLRMNDLTEDLSIPGAWTMCRNMELGKKKFGYCQAGTGFYISQKEEGIAGEFIAGIPGAGDWRGGIFTTTVPDEDEINPDLRRTALDDESAGVGLNSYLGFSVTSGKFGDKFMVASGAPRHNAIGAVVMISKHFGGLRQEYVLKGEQPAESFGYEVCSADLDGDGFDDLIVGAPIYYNRSTEAGGRVYIYLNKYQNGTFLGIEPTRLTGVRDSMFGMSIANLGDLNIDGYEDIAIGAPYENNGVGAVYIYHGGPDGIIQPASQKITPADLPDDLPTSRDIGQAFGYSLSGGLDLDGNQYPDLTIGAFQADALVTLRARPIISITAELQLRESQIDPNITTKKGAEAFRSYVQVQMKYECNADRFDESIRVEYSIEAEEERRDMGLTSRVIFEASDSYAIRDQTILLQPQSNEETVESTRFWFTLRPGFTDIFRKIPFKLNYKLPDVEVTTPTPGEPVPDLNKFAILNSQMDPSKVAEIDFIKACAQLDGECITDLEVAAYLHLDDQEKPVLRVGEHKNLFVTVTVRNNEEPAYDPKLTITFPEMLEFSKIEDDASQLIRFGCNLLEDNTTVIVCKLGYPYKEKQFEAFTLKFDTRDVPSDASNFTIRMSATSTNRDANPDDNQVSLFAEVQSITDIQIIGETNKEQYTFEGDVIGESAMTYTDEIGDEVIHTWTVYNNGSGIVAESVVTISFPYEVANGKWLLYLTHKPVVEDNKGQCEIDPIYVNELQLEERPEELTIVQLTTEASPLVGRSQSPNDESPTDGSKTTRSPKGRRRRRDVVNEEQGAQKSRAQEQQGQILTLNCYDKTARCFEFKCYMERLGEEDEAKIYVKSRLWKSTFLEDYINAKEVLVTSVGKIDILNAPFLTQSNDDNDVFNLTMEVKPSSVTLPPPEPLAWWIILVAVLVGIIILIILIILLWKVGFFRRPGTRSGGPCGFFERKTMGYKYATVTQKTAGGNAATEKTAYYDEKYFT
ncbi:integrin alpha-6-like isoform X2 [Asterias amurensis]|uniref:integrin alpha-6-like isoform X2 n=1 Tax=Asterias amurensis TaxID=7602 RepID=UPI003AB4D806